MNLLPLVASIVAGVSGTVHPAVGAADRPPLTTVANVDLKRYAGKWYEIARYPNRFQRDCQSDTSAIYMLRPNGKIQVVNACRKKDGKIAETRGTARAVDRSNARLKVTFFWPFSGDYWIVGLDPEYRWAVVGEPRRKYLWILSRSPRMNDADYQKALQIIEATHYDPSRLIKTPQSAAE
jgi:apolipoprotein D and lipocalin family protein